MKPQILIFSNFFIKNGSYDTIHTFKNYFVTVFFSFQFSVFTCIQMDPSKKKKKKRVLCLDFAKKKKNKKIRNTSHMYIQQPDFIFSQLKQTQKPSC